MAVPAGISNLFRPTKVDTEVNVGDLVAFKYEFWKNDPHPVVVVDKINSGIYVRGVNIHYLPFGEIHNLFSMSANNRGFNYQQNLKGKPFLASSLRTYKYSGIDISSLEVLDYQFVMQVMSMVRTFDPMEVEKMRKIISEQLGAQINPRAADITTNALAPPQGTVAPTSSVAPTPAIGPVSPTGLTPPGPGEI